METLSSTPLLDYIGVPFLDIFIGFTLRMILASFFESFFKITIFAKSLPLIGIPVSIGMMLNDHSLGTLTVFGIFIIDYFGLFAISKSKPSKESKAKA